MATKSQVIFMGGKELALKALFTEPNFCYLAIGYASEGNGFEDTGSAKLEEISGFQELEEINSYERIKLEVDTSSPVETDPDTGKVLVKFIATLPTSNIEQEQPINQLAIVDSKDINAETNVYSATTFPKFIKTKDSSITFVIGFRL